MMSEQTANLCTSDACESLRARLAKYEDAEGRSIGQLSAFNAGVKAASDKVKSILDDYEEQHGSTDPDTGTREYPGNGEEWVGQMMELIEDFTRIVAPSTLSAPSHGEQVREVCRHEFIDDGEFTVYCSKCGLMINAEPPRHVLDSAAQQAFEVGGTDDGGYVLTGDELDQIVAQACAMAVIEFAATPSAGSQEQVE